MTQKKINSNLTVFIPTYNEEKNISKTLIKLKDLKKIVVLDSYSTDKTVKLSKNFKNVKVKNIKFNGYVNKLNNCIKLCKTKWIMIIDADYILSQKLINNILAIDSNSKFSGFRAKIYFNIMNKTIKEDIYPSKIFIFKKKNAYFKKQGHKELLISENKIKYLEGNILHEDKKGFGIWLKGQINIANDELIFIKSPLKKKLKDKVRRFPILPIIALLLIYLFKINILKYGIPGLVFLCQRIIFETILNIKVIGSYLKIK